MRPVTIARNYSETLFELAERSGRTGDYGELLDAVAGALETTPALADMLMSPRVPKSEKARIIGAGLKGAPREFVLFLQAVVRRGRGPLLRYIATEYSALLDVKLNRLRAGVTLARTPDEALKQRVEAALSRALGKQVIASFGTDPEILGGAVVRVGERVYDGSVRRRLTRLRRQLITR
ncbi:MAG TPA: ATP synthase F1 subunit delta [Gemmatimonadales bacterium]|nr:ATP synthase F1 subunit delta [Gemmatimonadales bacterium]